MPKVSEATTMAIRRVIAYVRLSKAVDGARPYTAPKVYHEGVPHIYAMRKRIPKRLHTVTTTTPQGHPTSNGAKGQDKVLSAKVGLRRNPLRQHPWL